MGRISLWGLHQLHQRPQLSSHCALSYQREQRSGIWLAVNSKFLSSLEMNVWRQTALHDGWAVHHRLFTFSEPSFHSLCAHPRPPGSPLRRSGLALSASASHTHFRCDLVFPLHLLYACYTTLSMYSLKVQQRTCKIIQTDLKFPFYHPLTKPVIIEHLLCARRCWLLDLHHSHSHDWTLTMYLAQL